MAVIDNLVAYWPLDEASGNAIDAHTNSIDLTETGGTIAQGTGPGGVGNSRDFEAADTEYFNIADHTDLSMGDIDFEIAGWFNFETNGSFVGLVGKITGDSEYGLQYQNGGAFLKWNIRNAANDGWGALDMTTQGALSTGTWYFITVGHDSVNNLLFGTVNAGTPETGAWSQGARDGTAAFRIGDQSDSGPFDGLIAKVGVWKKVLTTGERTWLYNSGNGRSYAEIVAEAGGGGTPFFTRLGAKRLR
jgi:hypothetical protein